MTALSSKVDRVECPHCDTLGAKKFGPGELLIMAAVSLCIPIIGWIMFPILILASIGATANRFLAKKPMYYCISCKRFFHRSTPG